MAKPQRIHARILAAGAALALVSGCSTPSPPSGTTSTAATSTGPGTASQTPTVSPVCAAADAFSDALTGFKDSLKPGATREQVRAARDLVAETYDELVTAIGSAAAARVDAVRAAKDAFTAAVNDIPDDATLTDAIDSLRDEAANVQGALSDLVTEVEC